MIQAISPWYDKAEMAHAYATLIISPLRRVVSYLKAVTKLPEVVVTISGLTKFLGTIGLVFRAVNLKRNIQALQAANNTVDRIKSAARIALNISGMHEGVVSTIEACKTVGLIAKKAHPWTTLTGKIFYPFQFIACGLSIRQTYENALLYKEMKQNLSTKKIDTSSAYIKANAAKLQKKLAIADDLAASSTDKTLIKQLKTRVTTQLALSALSTALKIAATVTAAFTIFATATPVVLGVTAVIALLTLIHFVDEKMTMNLNLQDKPKDVWHQKLAYHVRVATEQAARKTEKLIKSAFAGG